LVAQSLDNLAVCLHNLGDLEAAEPLHRKALELGLRVLGPEHPEVAVTRRNLAALLVAKGSLDEAERELRACLSVREKCLPAADPRRVMTQLDLAEVLLDQGDVEGADPLVEAALDATLDLDAKSPAHRMALQRGAAYYDRRGQPERAAELRSFLPPP
jgi:tetratricopeptide (TPR) repeat protein